MSKGRAAAQARRLKQWRINTATPESQARDKVGESEGKLFDDFHYSTQKIFIRPSKLYAKIRAAAEDILVKTKTAQTLRSKNLNAIKEAGVKKGERLSDAEILKIGKGIGLTDEERAKILRTVKNNPDSIENYATEFWKSYRPKHLQVIDDLLHRTPKPVSASIKRPDASMSLQSGPGA
jgi:hypothetical protein